MADELNGKVKILDGTQFGWRWDVVFKEEMVDAFTDNQRTLKRAYVNISFDHEVKLSKYLFMRVNCGGVTQDVNLIPETFQYSIVMDVLDFSLKIVTIQLVNPK